MPLQVVSSTNTKSINTRPARPHDTVADGSALRVYDMQEKTPTKVKVGVFLTTLAGVTAAMLFSLKKHNLALNPFKNIFTSPKNWGIFNEKLYSKKELPWLVIRLAIGSVGGGLIGGAIFDKKENMKAKFREAVIQLIGNIGTPLAFVAGGMRLFDKFEPKILEAMKKIPDSMKFLKGKKAQGIPSVIASACCLIAGIFAGNKIGNAINKIVFKCNEKRTLKLSDMSPHIDDLGIATSFVVPPESAVGHVITRIIPAALMIAGFSTGVAQEHHGHKRSHHNKENNSSQVNKEDEVNKDGKEDKAA